MAKNAASVIGLSIRDWKIDAYVIEPEELFVFRGKQGKWKSRSRLKLLV